MASSFQDDPYRRPNFAADGAIPSYLRRPRVPPIPPIFSDPSLAPWPLPPAPKIPFPVPLSAPPHDVDPPEGNPYNDPDYAPFLVTTNQAGMADAPRGGLLGRLLALLAEQAANASSDGGSEGENPARTAEAFAASTQQSDHEQKPIRILGRRVVRY